MGQLDGKVAVVTGASKGIGAGIDRGLAEAGASVVVNYASDRAGADRVVAEIVGRGGKAVAVQGDVSRAAVDNLTRGLALKLAPRKVRVNAVAPGTTESEGTFDVHLFEGDEGKKVIASTPLGRLGTPADIARVVVFLASDDSAWVTGEIIRASGGLK